MVDIAFGLLLYKFLSWFIPLMAFVFLVIPFVMNAVNGDGFGANLKEVWGGVCAIFRFGTAKRS